MSINREEAFRIAAEKMRLKKEKEAREEKEFYERITSGTQWLLFKSVVVVCTLILCVTVVDMFVDGPSKKITEKDWKIDRNWEWTWHTILDIEGCMFAPELTNWNDRDENSLKLTYSPILRTPKKLSYGIKNGEVTVRTQEELRQNSIFEWFPLFQIFLLIPLVTYLFKRQSAWFNFARIASFVFVFPGALLTIYLTIF